MGHCSSMCATSAIRCSVRTIASGLGAAPNSSPDHPMERLQLSSDAQMQRLRVLAGSDEAFLAAARNPALLGNRISALCDRLEMTELVHQAAIAISRFAVA